MLSVPLEWHDQVVGVLNVQTREPRRLRRRGDRLPADDRGAARRASSRRAGCTAEVEARLAQLTALDAARAELLSVVTHELRTPLSVVRVYVDLLADAATGASPLRRPGDGRDVADRRRRPARPARPPGRLDPGVRPRRGPDRACRGRRSTRSRPSTRPSRRCGSCCGRTRSAGSGRTAPHVGDRRRDALPPGARAAARERVEVRPDRRGREHRDLAGRRRDPGLRHRRRAGRPASRTGRASSSRSCGSRAAAGRAARASGCSRRAG